MPFVQIKGGIKKMELIGGRFKKRLVGHFSDGTGELELVWFQGIPWILDKIKPGIPYVIFGKPNRYGNKISIAHPEIEPVSETSEKGGFLQPVYSVTEKLRARRMDSKFIGKLQLELLKTAQNHLFKTLPEALLKKQHLISKKEAVRQIHFPKSLELLIAAQQRLKFEELFYIQLRLVKMKWVRQEKFKGQVLGDTILLT